MARHPVLGGHTSTRRAELAEIQRFSRWAVEAGHMGTDPCAAVRAVDDEDWQVGFAEEAAAGPTSVSLRDALLLRGLSAKTVGKYQRVIVDAQGWCEDRRGFVRGDDRP